MVDIYTTYLRMAQDVLAVYENYYEKAIIHRDELKNHVSEQVELLQTISEELGETTVFEFSEVEQLPLNLQVSHLNEKVEALERIYKLSHQAQMTVI